jgi:hypothetical protein
MKIHRPSSGFSTLARILAILAVVGVAGAQAVSAETSSAQLAVGVTVVRSCSVDSRPAEKASPALRLTCTRGANSNLRLSEPIQSPAETISSDSLQIVTLNF